MKFTVLINQVRSLEWGLNSQQAMLFAYVFSAPSWATVIEVEGQAYFHLAKQKIIDDMPLLTDKPDTAYRILRQLSDKGVIDIIVNNKKVLIKVSEKGRLWDHDKPAKEANQARKIIRDKVQMAEKSPSDRGEISECDSEKSPTYKVISNKTITSDEDRPPQTATPQLIADLYNEILGDRLPIVKAVTPQRAKHIRARIAEDATKRKSALWWETFFAVVQQSDFLTGQTVGYSERTWRANFDWLINPNNLIKVVEGMYDDEQ